MGTLSRYILFALGSVMTGLFVILAGAMLLALLCNIIWTLSGDSRASWEAMLTEILIFTATSCFLNLVQTFRRLARIDAAAYQEATRGKGVISYIWSAGAAPVFLHRFLVSLDSGALPPSFARRVHRTIILDRVLIAALLLLLAFGICVAAKK